MSKEKHICQIAQRMEKWARSGFDPAKTSGYCMSGKWGDFYQKLLFPNKILRIDIIQALIQRLRELGFYAALAITPYENGDGLYLYMRMRHIQ